MRDPPQVGYPGHPIFRLHQYNDETQVGLGLFLGALACVVLYAVMRAIAARPETVRTLYNLRHASPWEGMEHDESAGGGCLLKVEAAPAAFTSRNAST
jgi:hypothetical protein